MITIEEVIEFFEQDYYTWKFKEPKEAAAVVRAQHEEIANLREANKSFSYQHIALQDRASDMAEEIQRLMADVTECSTANEQQAKELGTLRAELASANGWLIHYQIALKSGEPK